MHLIHLAAAAALSLASTALGRAGPGTSPQSDPKVGPPALAPAGAPIAARPARSVTPFNIAGLDQSRLMVTADLPALAEVGRGAFVIERFPLAAGRTVDLEVERFRITTDRTRFVIGGVDGRDAPAAFDPESVILLRGRAAGHPQSHVYLALSDRMTNGIIDLGPGRGTFGVSSRGTLGESLPPGRVTVFAASPGRGSMPLCTVIGDVPRIPVPVWIENTPRKGLRQVQLAVDTDLEFYGLFGDVNATNTYILQLYGAVSDICMRDINVRVDLTFTRVWTTLQPFTADLGAFRNYWNANMQSVPRDVAQMFSGRPDKPGGVAYLAALCNSSAYSFCGNANGFIADPNGSSVWNYDLLVAAHELGHNLGTHHTDTFGIDVCNTPATPARRGTIMSYCSQTVSGGNSVMDMRFHKLPQNRMLQHIATVTNANCVVYDCNQNGISDALDISTGFSLDSNANGIPDECEDCNGNGVLDPQDILSGTSQDQNGNGIPDECEPDCNNNGIPDDMDIASGFSQDLHGDRVPDECDADLNNNGQSDYNEIMANMPLDKNRDRVLDSVQDCDGDGLPDHVELEGAWNVWIANEMNENAIREFHAVTGVLMRVSQTGNAPLGQDVVITPDRRILVSSASGNKVVEFDRLGQFVRDLVAPGAGGLSYPTGMVISPAGALLVSSRNNNRVLAYDLATGASLGTFVAAGAGGLTAPFGLAFGSDGHLYVTSGDNRVLKFNGQTGASLGTFVAAGSGSLNAPRGLAFKPTDGHLLVASYANNRVLQFNGQTGAFMETWAKTAVAFQGPWGVRIGPSGNVYVSLNLVTESHVTKPRISEFDIRNGYWLRGYVLGNDTGFVTATGFAFMPGDLTDCNNNQIPDNCDILSGFSPDANNNGIPDECETLCYPDCNGDGVLNLADFGCFQTRFALQDPYADCNGDGALNLADFGCFQTRFALGCP